MPENYHIFIMVTLAFISAIVPIALIHQNIIPVYLSFLNVLLPMVTILIYVHFYKFAKYNYKTKVPIIVYEKDADCKGILNSEKFSHQKYVNFSEDYCEA